MTDRELEQRLFAGLASGRLSHAYVLEGNRADTEPVARHFAAALLCTGNGEKPCGSCPSCANLAAGVETDLLVLQAEASGKSGNRSLKDEKVTVMQERLGKKPLAAARTVAIVADADLLTERAQNHLLKTLEEPPGQSVLLLLSENRAHLLPTILSRCTAFSVEPDGTQKEAQSEEAAVADTCLRYVLEQKKYYAFLPLLAKVTEEKPQADAFLNALEERIGREAKEQAGSSPETVQCFVDWASQVEACRSDLARNVNVAYAVKDLIIKMLG